MILKKEKSWRRAWAVGQKAESGQSGDETLIRLIQILLGNLLIQAGQCSAKLEWIADSDLKARILPATILITVSISSFKIHLLDDVSMQCSIP